MKDSQPGRRVQNRRCKYIKESNERFSTYHIHTLLLD